MKFKLNIQLFAEGSDEDTEKGESGKDTKKVEKKDPKGEDTNLELSKRLEEMTSKVEGLTSSVDGIKDDLAKAKTENDSLKKENENLKKEIDELKSNYSESFVRREDTSAHDNKDTLDIIKHGDLFEAIINVKR